jgi:hypothetical protein
MVSATRAKATCNVCIPPRARDVQHRSAGELIDGIASGGGNPAQRLPQLPHFGMSVAQEYFLMFAHV